MSKKNITLAIILVCLVGLAWLIEGPVKDWQAERGRTDNILAVLRVDETNRIVIDNNGARLTLVKTGDRWLIEGTKDFYLTEQIQGEVINGLTKAKTAEVELAGSNPERKSEFQTGDSGARISLYQGEELLNEFVVGKVTPDFMGSFVSLPDSDKTYALAYDLRSRLVRSDWYNRTIFEAEKDKISSIRFQYPGREFEVVKEEDAWQGVKPYRFSVDGEKIDEILNIMSNLRAADIPEQSFEAADFENYTLIVQAAGEELDNTLMVGAKTEDGNYYAKRGDSDNIYLITEDQVKELDKQIWELR